MSFKCHFRPVDVLVGNQAVTAGGNASHYRLRVVPEGAVTIPSGTAAEVATLSVFEPNITATGTVIYQGEAFVDGITESGSTSFQARGVSTVTSDFNGGNVDVVINGLQNTPPFDRIEISSMSLTPSNATFGDGSVALFSGDEDVTQIILGAGYTTDASGAFFGLDSLMQSFQPDEVGGIFVGDGTNGTLSGGFLAD